MAEQIYAFISTDQTIIGRLRPAVVVPPGVAQPVAAPGASRAPASPFSKMIAAHNARIGGAIHRVIFRCVVLAIGILVALFVPLLFRVRVLHAERLAAVRDRSGIYVLRHFYEWDPLLTFGCVGLLQSLTRPHNIAFFLAGARFWCRNRAMRMLSWSLGILGLVSGEGIEQTAFEQAVALLQGRRSTTIGICPTGPLGSRSKYVVAPGVGHLAVTCPELPLLPITFVGLQGVRLRTLLSLKRPTLTFSVGEPLFGRDFSGPTAARVGAICGAIRTVWTAEEAQILESATDESARRVWRSEIG